MPNKQPSTKHIEQHRATGQQHYCGCNEYTVYSNNKEITVQGGCRETCKHKTCVKYVHKTLTLERLHEKDKLHIPLSVSIHLHEHKNETLHKWIV
jgi:hypothetical protein